MAYDTTPVSPAGAGLATPALLAQHNSLLLPFVPFSAVPVVTLAVGGPTVVAGVMANRSMTLNGFTFAIPITVGTSLTMTLALMVNGQAVTNGSATIGLSTSSGSVTCSPTAVAKGDRIEIYRNVTVAVGVSTGTTYGNFQLAIQ